MRSRRTLQDRFWPKVQMSEGCWTWLAKKSKDGYGPIGRGGKDGEIMRAHRASWEIHFGPIPEGMCVLHKCDNPTCVNPVHLFLGTNSDNVRDSIKKGRHKNPSHRKYRKLTADDAREIRATYRRYNRQVGGPALARKFGVDRYTIEVVVRGAMTPQRVQQIV